MKGYNGAMCCNLHRVNFGKLHHFLKLLPHLIVLLLQFPFLLQNSCKLFLSLPQPLIPSLDIGPEDVHPHILRIVLLLVHQHIAISVNIACIVLGLQEDIRHFLLYCQDLVYQLLLV